MYNVFADFHHASLLQSLILLFEKRLGGNVYRPIGMEWAEQGFWNVYDHPATQLQFLTKDQGYRPIDGTPPLNHFVEQVPNAQEGVYYCHDIDSGQYNKAIDLETFYKLPINIVIASIPQHVEPFKRLCALHPNHPKLIFQIGNAWTPEAASAPNIMASAKLSGFSEQLNIIEYHQEFDTSIFYPQIPIKDNWVDSRAIYSFVNIFQNFPDWQLFKEVEQAMPDFTFKSYGGQCRDGAVGPAEVLAEEMCASRFIWHTKAGGDGYGHIIHNAAAVGRPLIVKAEYYRGKLAEPLIRDGETCICIDGLSMGEIVEKIRFYNEPERYRVMCEATYENFKKVCNFDEEFKQLQNFLDRLL